MTPLLRLIALAASLILSLSLSAAPDKNAHGAKEKGKGPELAEGNNETPIKQIIGKVKNPVALDIDENGDVFVVETARYLGKGDFDNRGKKRREDDDQHIDTLKDREAVVRKLHKDGDLKTNGKPLEQYLTEVKDKVWKFSNKDADGNFQTKTLFYEGFNGFHSGIVAGVVARDGKVHVTAEPELWVFDDNDNKAANAKILHTGFAVKIGWYGHDLHGLVYGHDGKLYFSLADKAWHVTTPEGKVLANNNTGGVFRCNPDGSELEEFAVGLRNPQELAFDSYGNLFSGDNNCDAGDKARLVYVTEGSDHGWRFSHQSLKSRGPWLREKMWELRRAKDDFTQPAWIVPPIAYIGSGPSGFTAYPGIGMPSRYDNHFLIADFRGGRGNIDAFEVENVGAGFKMLDFHHVISGPANSSVRVGYDGKLYVADWGGGWSLNDRGNLFTLSYASQQKKPEVKALSELSKKDFNAMADGELAGLLAHQDMRIRQRAQFALARKGAATPLQQAATSTKNRFARLHGLWGLGMIARKSPTAANGLIPLLKDGDAEIRAQAAKTLGDVGYAKANSSLIKLASDKNLRTRALAIKALGKLKHKEALPNVIETIMSNANTDAYLRDACVFAMYRMDDLPAIRALSKHQAPSVRLAAVLALRRASDAALAGFLTDTSPMVATEAARAIYDQRIKKALPALAGMLEKELPQPLRNEAVLRRTVQANLYQGDAKSADRLCRFVANANYPNEHREAALDALIAWDQPPKREGVWGSGWVVARKSTGVAASAVSKHIGTLLANSSGSLLAKGYELARTYKVEIPAEAYLSAVRDGKSDAKVRLAAFRSLLDTPDREKAIELANKHGNDQLKTEALLALVQDSPEQAYKVIAERIKNSPTPVKQHAIRTLAKLKTSDAENHLSQLTKQLVNGNVHKDLVLDVMEAAKASSLAPVKAQITAYEAKLMTQPTEAKYAYALSGGNVNRGNSVFHNHAAAQCLRCHKMNRKGGDVGPDLSTIGKQFDAAYILRALVDPGSEIAKGYGLITVTTKDGKAFTGTLAKQDGKALHLKVEKKIHKLAKANIATQSNPVTGMPPMGFLLKADELRDVVAYLKSRR